MGASIFLDLCLEHNLTEYSFSKSEDDENEYVFTKEYPDGTLVLIEDNETIFMGKIGNTVGNYDVVYNKQKSEIDKKEINKIFNIFIK